MKKDSVMTMKFLDQSCLIFRISYSFSIKSPVAPIEVMNCNVTPAWASMFDLINHLQCQYPENLSLSLNCPTTTSTQLLLQKYPIIKNLNSKSSSLTLASRSRSQYNIHIPKHELYIYAFKLFYLIVLYFSPY